MIEQTLAHGLCREQRAIVVQFSTEWGCIEDGRKQFTLLHRSSSDDVMVVVGMFDWEEETAWYFAVYEGEVILVEGGLISVSHFFERYFRARLVGEGAQPWHIPHFGLMYLSSFRHSGHKPHVPLDGRFCFFWSRSWFGEPNIHDISSEGDTEPR